MIYFLWIKEYCMECHEHYDLFWMPVADNIILFLGSGAISLGFCKFCFISIFRCI